MGDSTSAWITFHAISEYEVRAAQTALAMFDDVMGPGRITLGHGYQVNTGMGDIADALAALAVAAPSAVWAAGQDGLVDEAPQMWMFSPELGCWTGVCDDGGLVLVPAVDVLAAIDDPARLHDLMGTAWGMEFDRLAHDSGRVVTAPPVFDIFWDRRTGALTADDEDGSTAVELSDLVQDGPLDTAALDVALASHGLADAGDGWQASRGDRFISGQAHRRPTVPAEAGA
jgi:hypothetical protein